ncbi:MAG: hypothetical protein WC227_02535 [Patescibacteria group bacterium]|jgi:hypothetical protein
MEDPIEIKVPSPMKGSGIKRKKWMLWSIVGVAVIALGGSAYAFRGSISDWIKKDAPVVSTTSSTETPAATSEVTDVTPTTPATTSTEIVPIVDAGVTWQTPTKLADLKLFKSGGDFEPSDVAYYQVATFSAGGSLIVGEVACGPGGLCYYHFKKGADGVYNYLTKHSSDSDSLSVSKYIATVVNIDSTTSYASISSPDQIATEKNVVLKRAWTETWYSSLVSPTKIATTSYGEIFRVATQPTAATAETSAQYITYYLKHADGLVIEYRLSDNLMTDDSVALVTFTGLAKNTEKYFASIIASHCGSGSGVSILSDVSNITTRLKDAGVADNGSRIYYFSSNDDLALTQAYTTYSNGRDAANTITKEAFLAKNPVFIWKNPFSDYETFFKQEFAPLGECGKPVVYLYPTKTTQVSVNVGAKITKSEPAYGKGWNVLADPSGKLTLNNVVYPNLFWEGIGKGEYPQISSGFVVKKADIANTLKAHLAKLGLNSQESADFMEYWLPKMPATPYTRLSWFGTSQMDRLAPLTVSPKPDSVIRIFLDFEGLNAPISLPEQKLKSIERKGFTVVEWGGLLRGN